MDRKSYKLVDGGGQVFGYQTMSESEFQDAQEDARKHSDGNLTWVEMEVVDDPQLQCPNCGHEIRFGLPGILPTLLIRGESYKIVKVDHLPLPMDAEDSVQPIPVVCVAPI